ncbi:MAG: sugar phosphate isomerase/epimerase [Dehalococcoidia bacterium]|nr:sugar phosphate isomerase/epimerase [Dehalococcoidia bacterium]
MIKLSLQSLSYRDTFNAGNIDLLGIIDKAGEYKMDGVDLHFTHFASTDDDYLEHVKQACLKRGLHMCYIGVSNNFGKTGEELREQIDLMKKWIDVAAKMGIPMIRAFGSWLPEGETEEQAWPRLVASTKEVAEYGQSKGVVVGLHNHNHGCIPATGDQVIRLMDDVDNPYYSHILDTGQYRGSPGASFGERGQEDPQWNFYGSIETSAPRAVHVRAKIYRIASGKEAWLDYERIMPIIKNVGYNGWMSIVFEGQDELDEPTAVPLANTYLRSMIAKHEM